MSESKSSRIDPSIIAALIGVIGTIVVTLISLNSPGQEISSSTSTPQPSATAAIVTFVPTFTSLPPIPDSSSSLELANQIKNLHDEVNVLIDRIGELDRTNQRLDTIDNRLSNIENVILDDPSKAIDTVILRRDIEQIRNEIALLRSQQSESRGLTITNGAFVVSSSIALLGTLAAILRSFFPGGDQIRNKGNGSNGSN